MGTGQRSSKKKGQSFVRVFLQSGTRANPLGDEELAIFCQCNNEDPSTDDVDIKSLVEWVNNNRECKRNQSNNRYRLSQEVDAMSIIALNEREIQSCHNADRIYPRLDTIL